LRLSGSLGNIINNKFLTTNGFNMVSRKLLDILACPKCKKPIDYDKENNQLICHRCRLKFKVKDEIPDMLLEDAEAF